MLSSSSLSAKIAQNEWIFSKNRKHILCALLTEFSTLVKFQPIFVHPFIEFHCLSNSNFLLTLSNLKYKFKVKVTNCKMRATKKKEREGTTYLFLNIPPNYKIKKCTNWMFLKSVVDNHRLPLEIALICIFYYFLYFKFFAHNYC